MTKKKPPFSTFGKIIVSTGMFRVYENGDSYGLLVRWYHPLTWLYAPLIILFAVLISGIPETFKNLHDAGLRMHPWFIKNPDRLKFVPFWKTL